MATEKPRRLFPATRRGSPGQADYVEELFSDAPGGRTAPEQDPGYTTGLGGRSSDLGDLGRGGEHAKSVLRRIERGG